MIARDVVGRAPRVRVWWAMVAAIGVMAVSCNGRILFDPNGCDDDNCGLPNLYCDVAAGGVCVPCLTDAHCGLLGIGLGRCDMALHRCVECGIDSDCGTGLICRARRCVTPCQIGDDSSCPASAPDCELHLGFCILCEPGKDTCASASAPGPICEEATGVCVSCLSDANCGGTNPRCDIVTGRCVECLGSKDCSGSTPLCDPATNRCVSQP